MPIPGGPRPTSVEPRPLAGVLARLGLGPTPATDGVLVTGVTLSSRTVRPGDLYAALPGARTHGAAYTADAADAGAVAVLTDPEGAERAAASGLPVAVVDDPRARLGELAAWVYGEPGTRLLTLGVTGTNGKTTTTFLLEAALEAAGITTGLIGTVGFRLAGRPLEGPRTTVTTPEATEVQGLLARMRRQVQPRC